MTDWSSTFPLRLLAASALWPTGCEARSGSIFFIRYPKQNNSRNSELLHFTAFLQKSVDRLLRDPGHRSDGLNSIPARSYE